MDRPGRSRGEFWVLMQGGQPVGTLDRAEGSVALRTASEEWRGGVRRRSRRLGWHLYFKQVGKPPLEYHPSTLRPGGHFVGPGDDRYRLRSSLLSTDWKLTGVQEGEICRFRFQRGDPRHHVQLALVEPMLLVMVLAASEAILIHHAQPSAAGGGRIPRERVTRFGGSGGPAVGSWERRSLTASTRSSRS
jgi:hypothetical protein